jgi:hypothetical protein
MDRQKFLKIMQIAYGLKLIWGEMVSIWKLEDGLESKL